MRTRAPTLALVAIAGCGSLRMDGDLRSNLLRAQGDRSLCRRRETELLAMLQPTVTVRVARPDELDRSLSRSSAAVLHRRAVLVHIETSTAVVEDHDARVETGFEVNGQPSRLVLPTDFALAEFTAVGGARPLEERAPIVNDINLTPLPAALQSFADGVRVGYATFIIPFVLMTSVTGRNLPVVEQAQETGSSAVATHSRNEWAFLGSVLERGGCQLMAGGGCRRWFVVPRPNDETTAPIALTFSVRIAGALAPVLSVDLPSEASATTIEQRIYRRFSHNTPLDLSRAEGVRHASICERRAR